MFSSGELILIGLVALIVIGPERLPKVARTAGHLLGRLQRYVSDVKADINREIQLEELKKMQDDVAAQVRDMEHSVNEQMKTVETELNQSIATGIEEKAAAAPAAAAPSATAPSATAPADAPPPVATAAAAPPSAPAAVPAEKPQA
ncbi:MAG: Sec-independent protein translocase protein TatB [Rhodocyclaceae bacterium]|nr:Sec-independent protein translocase protein TatB [Rhodocyclaceae bacterium]